MHSSFTSYQFLVSHAERVFVYAGLANGTTENVADYDNVAPFFLNETFPEDWFRRGDPFTLPSAFAEAAQMFLNNPRELGGNEGLDNFVPLGIDLSTKTPAELGCFVLENFFDLAPNQVQPTVYNNLELFQGFIQGTVHDMLKRFAPANESCSRYCRAILRQRRLLQL